MLTEADIKRFAPRAKREYVAALLGGIEHLRAAGVLESELRLAHFMGQVGAETDGLTIVRESLTYTTAARLRTVWPARFRNKSDAELAHLLRNPVALGDSVYGGRMGNNQPGDGYAYRGGGYLQTTGKHAVQSYCKVCGIDLRSDILDDIAATLRFACVEWERSGCNQWADENDITKVSKAINTGSATSNVKPVGMSNRQAWFAKAWAVWGGKGKPDAVAEAQTSTKPAMVATAAATTVAAIPSVPASWVESISSVTAWQVAGEKVAGFAKAALGSPLVAILIAGVVLGIWFGPAAYGRISRFWRVA
jgi:putative chitinase